MLYYFAPMEGITGAAYRRVHHHFFGGVDQYFTPFLSPTQHPRFTPRQLREISPEYNTGIPVIPQLLTKNSADFLWASAALADMGYSQVNLNLGCPSGTVVAKGKGAGFLANPDLLRRFLDSIFRACPLPISIKTRLGIYEAAEFSDLLSLFNEYPIRELIIHPRVQKAFYRGTVDRAAFASALDASRNPVCYNGDLAAAADCQMISARYSALSSVMLGRGLLANPALIAHAKGGAPLRRQNLRAFHDALYEEYCALFESRHNAMMHMKELWFYQIHLFEDSEKMGKSLRKATTPQAFAACVDTIFDTLPLRENAKPGWLTSL